MLDMMQLYGMSASIRSGAKDSAVNTKCLCDLEFGTEPKLQSLLYWSHQSRRCSAVQNVTEVFQRNWIDCHTNNGIQLNKPVSLGLVLNLLYVLCIAFAPAANELYLI